MKSWRILLPKKKTKTFRELIYITQCFVAICFNWTAIHFVFCWCACVHGFYCFSERRKKKPTEIRPFFRAEHSTYILSIIPEQFSVWCLISTDKLQQQQQHISISIAVRLTCSLFSTVIAKIRNLFVFFCPHRVCVCSLFCFQFMYLFHFSIEDNNGECYTWHIFYIISHKYRVQYEILAFRLVSCY